MAKWNASTHTHTQAPHSRTLGILFVCVCETLFQLFDLLVWNTMSNVRAIDNLFMWTHSMFACIFSLPNSFVRSIYLGCHWWWQTKRCTQYIYCQFEFKTNQWTSPILVWYGKCQTPFVHFFSLFMYDNIALILNY